MASAEISKDDWRLTFQEDYLKGVELVWTKYTIYREDWDHDHCEFCDAKLSLYEGDLHEGYATLDRYYWICKPCYEDFKGMFCWKLVEETTSP